uniref:DUF6316 family protein n=1 Tax=Microbulbifer agarilyticus TaxID=260552 RepID=UPI00025586C5|nr:DUF6316 family protein [Microbulbifer agarilyticus]
MQQYRRGEQNTRIPARSDRFYKLGDDWYFNVRGGKAFGPYRCRDEAEKALQAFLHPKHDYHGNVRPFGRLRRPSLRRT